MDIITTERFYLRELVLDDATPQYLAWFRDEAASRYIVSSSAMKTVDDIRSYIQCRRTRSDVLFFGIFVRHSNTHIGTLKFEPIEYLEKKATLGILVGESSWRGRGVAGEVIGAAAAWISTKLGINQLVLGVDLRNKQAIKSYKKLGFAPTGKSISSPQGVVITMHWDISAMRRYKNHY
jgi:ribosomal-protein-alanine N-acetyltransferase